MVETLRARMKIFMASPSLIPFIRTSKIFELEEGAYDTIGGKLDPRLPCRWSFSRHFARARLCRAVLIEQTGLSTLIPEPVKAVPRGRRVIRLAHSVLRRGSFINPPIPKLSNVEWSCT